MFAELGTFMKAPASREIGEMGPAPKRQPECREYRGREFGEDPKNVPSKAEQQAYYDKAQTRYASKPDAFGYRPREFGEDPATVQKPEKREMTEQERVLDMYA